MSPREPLSLRNAVVSLMLAALWASVAYVVFVGGVCVWAGVRNVHQEGFWVPVLIGGLTALIALRLACPLAGTLRSVMRPRGEEGAVGRLARD